MRDFSRWLHNRRDISLYLALRVNSRLDCALKDLKVTTLYYRHSSGLRSFFYARRLVRFIEANGIDLVHVHWKNDLFITALAKILSSRRIVLIHTRQMMVPGKKRDPYHWFIYRALDRFIAITKQIEQQAKENLSLSRGKVVQIYYGVRPAQKLKPEEIHSIKDKYQLGSKFTVGLVGRIDWYKAQYLLIDAITILKHKGIYVVGVMVGHAMDENYLIQLKQKVVDAGIADRIRFIDFTDKPHALMQCFDVLVLTTHVETFGLVLVEAMSLGIPVIGSNAGGVLEIIDHEKTGLLFKTKDAVSLADAIERVERDPELRHRLARAGEDKAKREYDTDRQHEKVLSLMSEVAGLTDTA